MLTKSDRAHQRNMPLRFSLNWQGQTASGRKPLRTAGPFALLPLGSVRSSRSQPSPWGRSRVEVNWLELTWKEKKKIKYRNVNWSLAVVSLVDQELFQFYVSFSFALSHFKHICCTTEGNVKCSGYPVAMKVQVEWKKESHVGCRLWGELMCVISVSADAWHRMVTRLGAGSARCVFKCVKCWGVERAHIECRCAVRNSDVGGFIRCEQWKLGALMKTKDICNYGLCVHLCIA